MQPIEGDEQPISATSTAGKFWTGKILTLEHAASIVRKMSYVLGTIAALIFIMGISNADRTSIITSLVLGALALGLHRGQSRVAAALLLMLSALILLMMVMIVPYAINEGLSGILLMAPLALLYLAFGVAAWRTFAATFALHRLKTARPSDVAVLK